MASVAGMRFVLSGALLALAAVFVYMAYYAVLNIADGDFAYVAVLAAELSVAGLLAIGNVLALRRG